MSSPNAATQDEQCIDAVAIVQAVVDDVVAFFAAHPECVREYLSEPEFLAAQDNPNVANMAFGNAVERMVADGIDESEFFSMFDYCGPQREVDFQFSAEVLVVGNIKGVDVTTVADAQAHIDRYAKQGIAIDCATYERPANFLEAFSK